MAEWRFPPPDEEFDYLAAVRALEAEDEPPVRHQHVVSRVVLKGFATQEGSRGWMLGRFDKKRGSELYPKGLRACGKIKGFVPYASASAEELWQSIENRLSDAIATAEAGGLQGSPDHEAAIKDGIGLHLVRSPVYRAMHMTSAEQAMVRVRRVMLTERRGQLIAEFRRHYGIDPAGEQGLEQILEQHLHRWHELGERGALLRVSLEQMLGRVLEGLRHLAVEVLHAPHGCEFVISDSPAFTFVRDRKGAMTIGMAIGDSHGIALPISSRCAVAIGPEFRQGVVTASAVDMLNRVQLQVAQRQVYYRPGSEVGRFLKAQSTTA